ncbi:type VI secretion system contractile sheath large subunit [Marinobacter xestospongiae]|uniref:Type VI secretion system contractile sheath large subunit n=1 Tax=Marinobacter xestospongiae TaxID=994319 RepID=A0ABU3VXB5_9GAMM|nr:type VI secretion system contractile sheath large subunit [Marinobacter xestospongiae]MDV2078925.1 type VI secretion system contractile sheath large subunit [Marinobacter xestospongiae]
MSAALTFVDKDYLNQRKSRPPKQPGLTRGLAERLVAESDDQRALMLFLSQYHGRAGWTSDEVRAALSKVILKLDRLLNAQLNEILHHPEFQDLEANWRGVSLLVEQAALDDRQDAVRIKVLDASWETVAADLNRAIEFDQSRLFAKVYSQEFGSPGGEPFGLLLGTYSVSHRTRGGVANLDTLRELAQVAAAAFSPLILNAAPSFFGVDNYSELTGVQDLESHFSQVELTGWRSLREVEDARFLGLAVPRMLMRPPHRELGEGAEAFGFLEHRQVTDKDYLWGPACFAFGTVAIRAFCESGWFSHIRGFRAGRVAHGTVDNMPEISDINRSGRLFPTRQAVDWQISDRMEKALAEEGFLPLVPLPNTPMLVFHSVPSIQQPKSYELLAANVSAKLSAMLHYILCVSRFAHYLKVMGRDRVGGYRTPEECESQLQRWIHGYTMATEGASDELRARFPLRDAKVSVKARAGEPGKYYSIIHLQPHFQLDQLVTGMRLITELTPVDGH